MGPLQRVALLAAALVPLSALPSLACEVPDEGGNTAWRRAVSKVKYLPETEAWSQSMTLERALVRYVVSLDEPKRLNGRCFWPVEVRADGKLWKRFLVTPDGRAIREDPAR